MHRKETMKIGLPQPDRRNRQAHQESKQQQFSTVQQASRASKLIKQAVSSCKQSKQAGWAMVLLKELWGRTHYWSTLGSRCRPDFYSGLSLPKSLDGMI